jgi:hypothetical protein
MCAPTRARPLGHVSLPNPPPPSRSKLERLFRSNSNSQSFEKFSRPSKSIVMITRDAPIAAGGVHSLEVQHLQDRAGGGVRIASM